MSVYDGIRRYSSKMKSDGYIFVEWLGDDQVKVTGSAETLELAKYAFSAAKVLGMNVSVFKYNHLDSEITPVSM